MISFHSGMLLFLAGLLAPSPVEVVAFSSNSLRLQERIGGSVSLSSKVLAASLLSLNDNDNDNTDEPDVSAATTTNARASLGNDPPNANNKRQMLTAAAGLFLAVTAFLSVPGQASAAEDQAMVMDPITSSVPSPASQQQTTANVRAGLSARRYWTIMAQETDEEIKAQINEGLIDYAVGTVNTMYYDNTGGARFTPREFYSRWRALRDETRQQQSSLSQQPSSNNHDIISGAPSKTLATREGAVQNLKWLISTLNDPYSKYLTREELWQELNVRNDGFLGIGALVEAPDQGDQFFARGSSPTLATVVPDTTNNGASNSIWNSNHQRPTTAQSKQSTTKKEASPPLSATVVQNLPVVTAVVPDSPAERSGITVGDRIVAVGEYTFLGQSREDVNRNFQSRFGMSANYFGHSDVTVAKPVVRTLLSEATIGSDDMMMSTSSSSSQPTTTPTATRDREVVIGYRQTRVRLPTKSLEEEAPFTTTTTTTTTTASVQQHQDAGTSTTSFVASGMSGIAVGSDSASISSASPVMMNLAEASEMTTAHKSSTPPTKGGNSIVHWELISGQSQQPSIFQRTMIMAESSSGMEGEEELASSSSKSKVGYIRLTRFSRASTAGYIEAVQALEDLGATSYIIDVRNNYGGVIQEAMLTASTLLRDPHAVLCYTMNARGGFAPHDVEEYVVDKRYPGYMLSREPRWVTLHQSQRDNPDMFDDDGSRWVPPSSYASLHEQTAKRGLHRPSMTSAYTTADGSHINVADSLVLSFNLQWNTAAANADMNHNQQWMAQRNLVILVNEGTASAAEVFASALHDNGRTLALIGTKSYGKGLIQHTFPMPDGGGLRLTVAEYLTPALHHVTVVGNAKFDPTTGEQVGGGIKPDLYCSSKQGIPSNIGADLCVGMALDVLEEAEPSSYSSQGQEKHHRQQHLKQRQLQEDFTNKGILVMDSSSSSKAVTTDGTSGLTTTSVLSYSGVDGLEQKILAGASDKEDGL